MSDSASPSPPAGAPPRPVRQEIKIISHSGLLYWWPIWFFGLVFTLWTYADNYRMAIVGPESRIIVQKGGDGRELVWIQVQQGKTDRLKIDGEKVDDNANELIPKIRVSQHTWMAPLYFVILFLVIMITNVPLRGLWSLVTIILIFVVALLLSLFDKWDLVLQASGDLHIFMNMAGYLAISTALLIAWVLAVMVFDRRTYIVFTPGQIRVCEEIGGREKVYDTTNLSLEKRRDDWFRHLFLGFGTGDLTVKTAGAERHEIVLPNVAFIAFKIDAITRLLSTKQISVKPVG